MNPTPDLITAAKATLAASHRITDAGLLLDDAANWLAEATEAAKRLKDAGVPDPTLDFAALFVLTASVKERADGVRRTTAAMEQAAAHSAVVLAELGEG